MEEMLANRDFSEGVTREFRRPLFLDERGEKGNPSLVRMKRRSEPPIDLYQIIVKVTWSSGKGQKSLEIESCGLQGRRGDR